MKNVTKLFSSLVNSISKVSQNKSAAVKKIDNSNFSYSSKPKLADSSHNILGTLSSPNTPSANSYLEERIQRNK